MTPIPAALNRKLIRTTVSCARLSLPWAGKYRAELEDIYNQLEAWVDGKAVDLEAISAKADAVWDAAYAGWKGKKQSRAK